MQFSRIPFSFSEQSIAIVFLKMSTLKFAHVTSCVFFDQTFEIVGDQTCQGCLVVKDHIVCDPLSSAGHLSRLFELKTTVRYKTHHKVASLELQSNLLILKVMYSELGIN